MPPTKVSTAHLIACFRAFLEAPGASLPDLDRLGPTLGLIVDAESSWRADGLAATRRALILGLEAWESDSAQHPRFTHGITAHDVVSVLSRVWGLTSLPVTFKDAGESLGRSDQTVANWHTSVVESRALRERLALSLPPTPPSAPSTSRPDWSGIPAVWLDPSSGAAGWQEWKGLCDRMSEMLAKSDQPGAPLRVLRDHVADAVMDDYLAFPGASLLRRSFRGLVLGTWFWNDHGSVKILTGQESDGDTELGELSEDADQLRLLGRVVQMFAHDLVTPHGDAATDSRVREKVRARAEIRGALLATEERVAGRTSSLRAPRSELEFSLRRSGGAADIRSPLSAGELRRSASTADELDKFAKAIRAARHSPVKRQTAMLYLAMRRDVDWSTISVADAVVIQVADHSVHLDAHRLRDDAMVRELSALIRATRQSARSISYRRLPDRIEALGDARAQRFDHALAKIESALREADSIDDVGVGDPKALLESRQQIRLTGAGIAVRMAESALAGARVPEPDEMVSRCLGIAHHYASEAIDLLAELDSPTVGLGDDGDERYISASIWRTLPRIVNFRVNVATLVARESGLLGQVSFQVPRTDWVEAEYVRVMSLTEVREEDTLDTIRAALWIAFMRGGSLPAVPTLTLERAGFLDVPNPAGVRDWANRRIELNLDQVDSLFRNLGMNAGAISKVNPGGAVATMLGSKGDRRFAAWLAAARPKIGLTR